MKAVLLLLFVIVTLAASASAHTKASYARCILSRGSEARAECFKKFQQAFKYKRAGLLKRFSNMSDDDIEALNEQLSESELYQALEDDNNSETSVNELADDEELESDNSVQSFLENKFLDPTLLWDKYRQALFTFINRNRRGSGSLGLQVVDEQLEANWDRYPENLGHLANRVSKYGSQYQETALSLPKQYEKFLLNIDIPFTSSSDRQALSAARASLQASMDKYQDAVIDCRSQYKLYKSFVPGMTYPQFQQSMCSTLRVHRINVERANGQLVELEARTKGAYRDAIDATSNFFDQFDHTWTETGTSLSSFVKKAKAGHATKFSVQFNSKTSMAETRTWTKKKRRWFRGRTTTREEKRFEAEFFNMEVKADGIQAISVVPTADWFSFHTVQKYKAARHMFDKSYTFVGDAGSMPLLPKTYYVVYNPTLVMNMAKKDSYWFEERKMSSFGFGPFNSAKGSTLTIRENKDGTSSILFATNNDVPQIIAVDNHVL